MFLSTRSSRPSWWCAKPPSPNEPRLAILAGCWFAEKANPRSFPSTSLRTGWVSRIGEYVREPSHPQDDMMRNISDNQVMRSPTMKLLPFLVLLSTSLFAQPPGATLQEKLGY